MKQKNKKLKEGIVNKIFGGSNPAVGLTPKEKYAQTAFINTFVAKASSALQTGIGSGLIDPNVAAGPPPGAPGAQQPAFGAQQPAPGTVTSFSGNPRAATGSPVAKKPPAAPVNSPVKKPINYTKNQPGLKENHYRKLNDIFESIMEATGGQSISAYLTGYFKRYMGNVPYNQELANKLIKEVEASYNKDRGAAALTKLAQFAFASQVAGHEETKTNVPPQNQIDVSKLDDNQLNGLLKQIQDELATRRNPAASATSVTEARRRK